MSDDLTRDYDFRVIAYELIDPPSVAMRENMDDGKLAELAADIRRAGVQSPLGVFEVGERFRIIYGHRRYVAAGLVAERKLPCRVHKDGSAREEDYKFRENYYREEVNPAEEATWLAHLLEEKHGGAIEALCAELNLTESFVNGRLDLLAGDVRVLDALRKKQINLAVARELNKIKHRDYLAVVLTDAVREGLTAGEVMRRRQDVDRTLRMQEIGADPAVANLAPSREASVESVDACLLCESPEDPLSMIRVAVHKDCLTSLMRRNRTAAAKEA